MPYGYRWLRTPAAERGADPQPIERPSQSIVPYDHVSNIQPKQIADDGQAWEDIRVGRLIRMWRSRNFTVVWES
jgi:hypothetical protein